ncbi:MAG: flagellar assembly protein FliH [Gammaproteobacteria bacterium]|nr:flagellar assembly protein FliH [Gammaproteobacteria bacterium]
MDRKKTNSQVIRGDKVKVAQWRPPQVNGQGEAVVEESHGLLTAAQLGEIQRAAHEEGFEQGRREGQAYGHREGLEEGRAEIRARVERLEQVLAVLDRPFEQLDQQLENEIVTLVISMVRQLIRREVKLDPAQIVGVVREGLSVLPIGARNIRVVLHPEDAELIREAYTIGEHEQKWHIIEDPVVQRGGCRIHTDTSQVDATLESRLNSLIAPLIAGERINDSDEADPHGA